MKTIMAFPQDLQGRRGDDPELQGMSLRQWYAGCALTGILASGGNVYESSFNSEMAFRNADNMIELGGD